MIRLIQLVSNNEKTLQPQELQQQSLTNVWLELVEPTDDELKAASDAAELPINFLRLPKNDTSVALRLEQGYGIIYFPLMQDVVSTKKAYPLVMVFSKNLLVTVACKEAQAIMDNVKARMNKTKVDPPSQVVYFLIDEIVATHYGQMEKLENLTAKIEEEVVDKTSSEILKKIFKLKSNMISFNKILWYERGLVFNLHKCGDSCMDPKARDLFDTTHENLTRQIDIVDTYREILSDAINVHLSAVSNKINLSINSLTIVIFYLTIITTVTSFPNTVATFFGISQFGGTNIGIIALAVLLSIILPFIWLWRKKWLKFKNNL